MPNVIVLSLTACPAGTYRSMTDNHDLEMCLPCPLNSMTDVTGAAAVCECVDGYFRKEPEEGPEFDCTCMSDF